MNIYERKNIMSKVYEINGYKLEQALIKRGKSLKEVSREIGYTEYFLHKSCAKGQINNIAYMYLNNLGITLDEITGGEDEWKDTYNKRVTIDPIKIYNYKVEHDTTYTEMSRKIGRGHSFFSNYFSGANSEMHISDVNKIKEVLGVDITYEEPKVNSNNATWQQVAEQTTNNLTGGINAIENVPTKPNAKKKFDDEIPVSEMTNKDLYRTIYAAVKHALVK